MKTFTVEITQTIEISLDETKFDAEFLNEFDTTFYNFNGDIERHAKHLAWLFASGQADSLTDFIEGYGKPKEFGIERHIDTEAADDIKIVNNRPDGEKP